MDVEDLVRRQRLNGLGKSIFYQVPAVLWSVLKNLTPPQIGNKFADDPATDRMFTKVRILNRVVKVQLTQFVKQPIYLLPSFF